MAMAGAKTSLAGDPKEQLAVLLTAAEQGRTDIVKTVAEAKLVSLSAPRQGVTGLPDDGKTALHLAMANGHVDVVRALLKEGCDVSARDNMGMRPIDAADANCQQAIEMELFQRVAIGDCTGVSQLLDAGVCVMCTGGMATADTPLHWAASFGNVDVIELLVARGADVNSLNAEGATALHEAASKGHEGARAALLTHGANSGSDATLGTAAPQEQRTAEPQRRACPMVPSVEAQTHCSEQWVAEFAEAAAELDRADVLSTWRQRYESPRSAQRYKLVYMNSHALGPQPCGVQRAVSTALDGWLMAGTGARAVGRGGESYASTDSRLSAAAASLLGAKAHEVAHLSAGLAPNMQLLLGAFYRPTASRYRVLIDASASGSLRGAVAAQCCLHGIDPDSAIVTARPRAHTRAQDERDALAAEIAHYGRELAVVLLQAVHPVTGEKLDLQRVIQSAQSTGATVGVDLTHAVGVVPLRLHEWLVDFAAWGNHGYVSAGPGSPGGVYVHERHLGARKSPSGSCAGKHSIGGDSAAMLQVLGCGVPSRVPLSAQPATIMQTTLLVALDLIVEAGIERVAEKSAKLCDLLERAVLAGIGPEHVKVLTPPAPGRASLLSFELKDHKAEHVHQRLAQLGVVCSVQGDASGGSVLSVGPSALYNTFADCVQFAKAMSSALGLGNESAGGTKPTQRSIVLSAGSKETVQVACNEGDAIQFGFGFDSVNLTASEVQALDVGFEVVFVGRDYGNFNERNRVLGWARVKPRVWPDALVATYVAPAKGNLELTFDNSYSWIKSKAITCAHRLVAAAQMVANGQPSELSHQTMVL